jgi:hypothetical protein
MASVGGVGMCEHFHIGVHVSMIGVRLNVEV